MPVPWGKGILNIHSRRDVQAVAQALGIDNQTLFWGNVKLEAKGSGPQTEIIIYQKGQPIAKVDLAKLLEIAQRQG